MTQVVKLDDFSPTAPVVFFRTYSRRTEEGKRESWEEVTERTNRAIAFLGKFTPEETELTRRMQSQLKAIPSGRWLWMGGTEWGERPTNYYGAYNCCSLNISGWEDFARNFNYSMQGCGVGGVIEPENLEKLPTIVNTIELEVVGEYGEQPVDLRLSKTLCVHNAQHWKITVGDSREGWNKAFLELLELSSNTELEGTQKVVIDVSHVRPKGESLKGFGGVANPIGLKHLFKRVVEILNGAIGRKLNWVEACLLLDEAGKCTVAGNIRRSAGMRQLSPEDPIAIAAKYNLWQQGSDGTWKIDPDRDALRMANHTRVFHHKPTEEECIDAVRQQWLCGEGAIQWAGEAVARANADLLDTEEKKKQFLSVYKEPASVVYLYDLYLRKYGTEITKEETIHRLLRYGLNPCFRGDMQLLTVDGYKRFDELDGKEVQIINAYGEVSASKVWCSGEKKIVKLQLSNQREIFCTPDHVFMTNEQEELPASDCEGKRLMPYLSSKGSFPTAGLALSWAVTVESITDAGIAKVYDFSEPLRHWGVVEGLVVHNCGEEFGTDFFCNLSEVMVNRLEPSNGMEQVEALRAASLNVAALLHQKFPDKKMQRSRELDPRVGVGICGIFDFFVNAFGADYLVWWAEGRPNEWFTDYRNAERRYLEQWREVVHNTIWEYCDRHNLKRPNRCTTVQPSGCLDRTALRVFDQGLIYADEIVYPGSGEIKGLNLTIRGGIKANSAIANQPLNLIKVTLENGRVLRMTHNHRLSIDGRWVMAADMQPGMKIDYSIGQYSKKSEPGLSFIDAENYTREARTVEKGHGLGALTRSISVPALMSPDLGYFLGCLFGNGCMSASHTRVRFSHRNLSVLNKLQSIGLRLFGIEGSIYTNPKKEDGELVFASKQLFDWLNDNNLGKKAKSKDLDRIPYPVRISSKETILSFFCGLIDTDGCVKEAGSLSIDSASEQFIRNLQQVGEAIGLCFSVFHNTQGENKQAQRDMWGLCLSRMLSVPDALNYLNQNSIKCLSRPLPVPKRSFKFYPYKIVSVEFETTPDYSYDFAISGKNDDDSWYWQGAIKSHNTKALLTGASPGWQVPYSNTYLRRITIAKNDPVGLACLDCGYRAIPENKDETGTLLPEDAIWDERCHNWLIEIPVRAPWADIADSVGVEVRDFTALTKFDFYMQVQKYWTRSNTSGTINLTESEIEGIGRRVHEVIANDEGYISVCFLAKDEETFPRMPFEPIDRDRYQSEVKAVMARRVASDFETALALRDDANFQPTFVGPAGCDSDKCLLPEK